MGDLRTATTNGGLSDKIASFGDAQLNMDPLVARAHHNLTRSPLLRMPDTLVLQIMGHLEISDLIRLRRTSRAFMRLFGSKMFGEYHDPPYYPGSHEARFGVWQYPSKDALELEEHRDELLREMYCTACYEARQSRAMGNPCPELEFLHCSACGSDHLATLFSATDRRKPAESRVCIGRQGSLKLCEHVSLSWDDIEKWNDKGDKVVSTCKHPCHAFRSTDSVESPTLRVRNGDSDGRSLALRKDTIIALPIQGGRRPTAQEFRQRLEEVERVTPSAWFPLWHPMFSPMRLVDPNRCCCLTYDGADGLNWELRPRSAKWRVGEKEDDDNDGGQPLWCQRGTKLEGSHWEKEWHGWVSEFHFWGGSLCMTLSPCGDDSVYLQQSRRLTAQYPWQPSWYLALDPKSYELPHFYGVAWCLNKTCRNYAGLHPGYPLPRKGGYGHCRDSMNRPCGKDCPPN